MTHAPCTPPSNKPLQWTIPPQGHWCNINEPLARRLAAEAQR